MRLWEEIGLWDFFLTYFALKPKRFATPELGDERTGLEVGHVYLAIFQKKKPRSFKSYGDF